MRPSSAAVSTKEFKVATRELFRQADLGLYQLFVSVVTEGEMQGAPPDNGRRAAQFETVAADVLVCRSRAKAEGGSGYFRLPLSAFSV